MGRKGVIFGPPFQGGFSPSCWGRHDCGNSSVHGGRNMRQWLALMAAVEDYLEPKWQVLPSKAFF